MCNMFPDPILEKEIFPAHNLNLDCDTIGRLLYEYIEKFILSALEDGEYAIAVGNYLRMLSLPGRTGKGCSMSGPSRQN